MPYVNSTAREIPVRELEPTMLAWNDAADCVAAVVGLGYVGLPTSLALARSGVAVRGIDVSSQRREAIAAGRVDLPPDERRAIGDALSAGRIKTSGDFRDIRDADVVMICVPTPVDEHLVPDTAALRSACLAVVEQARAGQCIVLTSTTYVGCTRELLVEPLSERGLRAGNEVHVAFMPERIDPGTSGHGQHEVPRVVGGVTSACAERAARLLAPVASEMHIVSSLEAAELTKLHENTFRAINIAYANEMAAVAARFGLDITEVIDAAATKPYGFMAFRPGPGVGGHCIPCDPHYLLWGLRSLRASAPLIDTAMTQIAMRPQVVVDRALGALAARGLAVAGARVLVVGVAYKPGVEDVRESPAIEIIERLDGLGAKVSFTDRLVASIRLRDGRTLDAAPDAANEHWDLVLVHGDTDEFRWTDLATVVVDATYRLDPAPNRVVP